MKRLLMSSLVLIIFGASLILFQLSSCKKAGAQVQKTYPLQGLWIGAYSGGSSEYFSLIIKPDGKIISDTKGKGVQHLAIGTWTLNGSTLSTSATYVYGLSENIGITQTCTATWNPEGTITGTWKNVAVYGEGNFTLTRVN